MLSQATEPYELNFPSVYLRTGAAWLHVRQITIATTVPLEFASDSTKNVERRKIVQDARLPESLLLGLEALGLEGRHPWQKFSMDP